MDSLQPVPLSRQRCWHCKCTTTTHRCWKHCWNRPWSIIWLYVFVNPIFGNNNFVSAQPRQNQVPIFTARSYDNWTVADGKPKREMASVVLERGDFVPRFHGWWILVSAGLATALCKDARLFFNSRQWYQSRGLNFRRGYLFYGVPGSGKTHW